MSVNLQQGIRATVSQQMVMTVQQQQSLKLLQYSSLELETELKQMLQDNPLLELVGGSSEEGSSTEDYPTYRHDDEEDYSPEMVAKVSLQDYLLEQLGTSEIDDFQKTLVSYLIGDIDDNGYLSSTLPEIVTALSELLHQPITLDEGEQALAVLQSFDPAGIGARSLAECLLLQLDKQRLAFSIDVDVLSVARIICEKGLDALVRADLNALEILAETDIEHIRQAHQLIRRLNPKPGKLYSTPEADLAIPDVLTRYKNGSWEVYINPQVVPKLRINAEYERMLKVVDKASASKEMLEQLHIAKLFMTQLNQRFATLLAVAQSIMQEQYAFFQQGLSGLKPLTLKVIAEQIGVHESTVSRAINQKFMATPYGVFELKRFFSSGVATQEGEQASATAIQQRIRAFIEAESKAKPLSDSKLTELLEKEGIAIARRTVAKYREGMNIPTASLRKAQALLQG